MNENKNIKNKPTIPDNTTLSSDPKLEKLEDVSVKNSSPRTTPLSFFQGINHYINFFLLLISLLALLSVGYLLHRYHQLQATVIKQEQNQTSAFTSKEELMQQVQYLTKQQEAFKDKMAQDILLIQQNVKAIVKKNQDFTPPTEIEHEQWMLQKARQYVELAAYHAKLQEDNTGTISLLEEAKQLIQSLPENNDPKLANVLAKINQGIKTLEESDSSLNRKEALVKLETLQPRLIQLPLRRQVAREDTASSPPANISSHSDTTIPSTTPSSFKTKFYENLNRLGKLISVRRQTELPYTLLPVYQTLKVEGIRMQLQEAQWALIQNNPIIWGLSLSQAIQLTEETYDTNNPITQEFIKTLQHLQSLSIEKRDINFQGIMKAFDSLSLQKPRKKIEKKLETKEKPATPYSENTIKTFSDISLISPSYTLQSDVNPLSSYRIKNREDNTVGGRP